MTQAVAHILEEAERLTTAEREELADCLVMRIRHDIPADILADQLVEVRRRIEEIESGQVRPIAGEEAFAHVRRSLAAQRAALSRS